MSDDTAILNKIIGWLETEIEEGQEFVDAYEDDDPALCSDGTDLIYVGRHEYAESLLDSIMQEVNKTNV